MPHSKPWTKGESYALACYWRLRSLCFTVCVLLCVFASRAANHAYAAVAAPLHAIGNSKIGNVNNALQGRRCALHTCAWGGYTSQSVSSALKHVIGSGLTYLDSAPVNGSARRPT